MPLVKFASEHGVVSFVRMDEEDIRAGDVDGLMYAADHVIAFIDRRPASIITC